ncbi:hypothetical protein, unknown function [Leishmania tarentolae]|uniref:Uncharacterized protein n=1 Tax=Leishmania tarentolae TaxID=5689 RepID=A0A640KBP2_LEITA|nr:hypothetical protein, unknown function [Leishmania tarentolae]
MVAFSASSSVVRVRRHQSNGQVSLRVLTIGLMLALLLPATCSSASFEAIAVNDHPGTAHESKSVHSARLEGAAVKATLGVKKSNAHVLRKQTVREMSNEYWYLLDGDNLIPRGDKKVPCPSPRHKAPLSGTDEEVLDWRSSQTRDHAFVHAPQGDALVKERHRRAEHRVHTTASFRKPKAMADGTAGKEDAACTDAGPLGVTLDSLRVVIRYETEAANMENTTEGHEDSIGEHASSQHEGAHRRRRSWEHSADGDTRGGAHRCWRAGNGRVHRCHGLSMLLRHSDEGVHGPITPPKQVIEVADGEHDPIKRRSDGDVAVPVSADAKNITSAMQSEEDLQRRCLVASNQDSKAALTKALQEGKLPKDCLIVFAEVGNEIPSSGNNAKSALAMISLSVAMLFGAFLLVF